LQQSLIEAGWLGRKSGRGFFSYGPGAKPALPDELPPIDGAGVAIDLDRGTSRVGEVLVAPTDGRTAALRALQGGQPVVLYDLLLDPGAAKRVALAASPDVQEADFRRIVAGLQAQGKAVSRI